MSVELDQIAAVFRKKGLNPKWGEDKDSPYYLLNLPEPYEDYGISLFFDAPGDRLTVIVWESFAGTQVSQFWTTNYEEILALALLNVVPCDIAIANF